jgi:hypothetical protein
MQGGDLSLTRCRLHGPLSPAAENFESLITFGSAYPAAVTLLMRDNVLTANKLLIRLDENAQLKARNNVFFSLGDGMRIDGHRPSVPIVHLLDHNTFAIRQNCFVVRTGPEFQASAPALLHANSNAFVHPFADSDPGTLFRGGQAWVHTGYWSWQGRYNVYDTRWHAFFGPLDQPAVKQKLADWKRVWGPIAEQDALSFDAGASARIIQSDTVTLTALLPQLDRIAIDRSIRGDPDQSPPGANLVELGVKKK